MASPAGDVAYTGSFSIRACKGGRTICFAIIENFASKSPSHMRLGVVGLKIAFLGLALVLTIAFLVACGGYKSPNTNQNVSGVKFPAFVSQNVSTSSVSGGLDIVDATLDRLIRAPGVSDANSPGLMAVSGNRAVTLVFDAGTNAVNVVNNKQETSAGTIPLPNWTESLAVTPDASVGYAAVLNAPVAGQASGAVEMMNLSTLVLETPITVPSVHYIVLSPDSTRLLAFSDNSDNATLINFQNISTTSTPNWVVNGAPQTITGLNRPVWATFSNDSSTAYIMNCGQECSPTAPLASVSSISFANNPTLALSQTLTIPGGATYGVLQGTRLSVAGTTPGTVCGTTPCGTLNVIDVSNVSALQVMDTQPITDGYHNRMAITADNQVFVGARMCSGPCLSMYNATTRAVVIGSDMGDVTAVQPVTGRPEVYVVENGELRVWLTPSDTLQIPQNQMNISGFAGDVKIVD